MEKKRMRKAKLKLKGFEEEIIYYMLMQKQHTIFYVRI